MVEIEFLDIGGEFVPKLHGMTKFDSVYVALLADIVSMKALAYQDREKADDLEDLNFALSIDGTEGGNVHKISLQAE